MLKKAAPRRCLSESLRSLKDMTGGRGSVDGKVVVVGGFCNSVGGLLMCVDPRDVSVQKLEIGGFWRRVPLMVVCYNFCGWSDQWFGWKPAGVPRLQ
jgi:hypothetical protein